MKYVTAGLIAGAACLLFCQEPPAVDFSRLGPAVGSLMPDFRAVDAHGNPQRLRNLLGPNGALILFFRSADW